MRERHETRQAQNQKKNRLIIEVIRLTTTWEQCGCKFRPRTLYFVDLCGAFNFQLHCSQGNASGTAVDENVLPDFVSARIEDLCVGIPIPPSFPGASLKNRPPILLVVMDSQVNEYLTHSHDIPPFVNATCRSRVSLVPDHPAQQHGAQRGSHHPAGGSKVSAQPRVGLLHPLSARLVEAGAIT